jgi:hypothetical protein
MVAGAGLRERLPMPLPMDHEDVPHGLLMNARYGEHLPDAGEGGDYGLVQLASRGRLPSGSQRVNRPNALSFYAVPANRTPLITPAGKPPSRCP